MQHETGHEAGITTEQRYRTLVETIPEIVYSVDPEGLFTFLNGAVDRLGYTPEELLGRHFGVIVHPDDLPLGSREFVIEHYRENLGGDREHLGVFDERRTGARKTVCLEMRLLRKDDGSPLDKRCVHCDVSASGYYESRDLGSERSFLGTIGVIREITERKEAEEQRRRAREAHTLQERLRGVIEMAGAACHELNQPLQVLYGRLELILLKMSEDDPLHEHVRGMQQTVDMLGAVTHKLSHITRYITTDYGEQRRIVDIDRSAEGVE